ncbi:MAG: aminodeoxychorismate/anthranilate synthase component II, partial [Muribaculaceae bacterium]|nr:aminodeoxychorismate/anthranilate synthase component II [Muribaculaceae bacterium]
RLVGSERGIRDRVGRYHSWVVSDDNFPDTLFVTARDEEGLVMALRHRELPLFGFQFHPESIMTETGDRMLHNFLTEVVRLRHLRVTKTPFPNIC